MLLRLVRLPLRPEAVPAFLALFAQSEARIRAQPGCQALALGPDAAAPDTYCTVSYWASAAALDAYRGSELFGEVWPATKRLLAGPPQAYSVLLPSPTPSPSPAGEGGHGGLPGS